MTPNEKASEIVMLTPTQEAMQWVWEQRKSTNSKDAISALDAVYQHLQKVTLEKEKEMLAGVWLDAQVAYQGDEYIKPSDPTFDEYYEETFNTEEK